MDDIEEKISKYKSRYDNLERNYNKTQKKEKKQVLHDKMIDVFSRLEECKELEKDIERKDMMITMMCTKYLTYEEYFDTVKELKEYWKQMARKAIKDGNKIIEKEVEK